MTDCACREGEECDVPAVEVPTEPVDQATIQYYCGECFAPLQGVGPQAQKMCECP